MGGWGPLSLGEGVLAGGGASGGGLGGGGGGRSGSLVRRPVGPFGPVGQGGFLLFFFALPFIHFSFILVALYFWFSKI